MSNMKKAKSSDTRFAIGTTVSKVFFSEEDGTERPFSGEVIAYDSEVELYLIRYDDGDQEEMDDVDLSTIIDLSYIGKKKKQVKRKEPSPKKQKAAAKKKPRTSDRSGEPEEADKCEEGAPEMLSGRTPRRSAKKKVVYYADSESDFDEEESEDEVPKKRKKRASGKPKAKGKPAKAEGGKKKVAIDSDNDDFMPGSEAEEEDESFAAEMESEMEVESEEEEYAPKKKGRKGGKRATAAAGKKQPAAAATSAAKKGAAPKTKMADMFTPMNNPIFWNKKMSSAEIQKNLNFLDPCGMEATDDIIDRLVGEQLDRIGGLLKRALTQEDVPMLGNANNNMNSGREVGTLGSQSNPLVLGTACSGTDAPALALMLVQEQLEKRGMGDLFKHDHVFSCEKEPFKQSYLARNFDSILYPDIVKLCDDQLRDVYGQVQPIPEFNMFVAGTSCKNFSMLMANRRTDIEDKGCSGETFLAACEVLFKEKPRYAIFENVTGAPWAKMSEYITGRINLSECATGKKIKGASKGKDGDLEFVQSKSGKIQVDRVPSNYGVRCGAIVSGYCQGSSTTIHKVSWPSKSKKRCTLAELAQANGINRERDTLILENEVLYCTHWIKKLDTKNYGLPQTRERTYMFVWQPDGDDFDDDLGKYWEAIVTFLASPARHSLESFILEVDHDIIRTFREALNGPAGRYTHRNVNLAPDFWNKETPSANLPHNLNTRKGIGMEELFRENTNWGPFGEMHLPPHWWLEYLKCTSQRHLDLLEILHASAARDAVSKDSNFASHFWNISQNATREKHRSAVAGIASCITPGGDLFLPHAGRPLLGCEKLLLQGIPYFRLLLGNETEVQLGDLAGNAMSLTVVCATMLGAITCKQLRQDHNGPTKDSAIISTLKSINKKQATILHPMKQVARAMPMGGDTTDTKSLFKNFADLAEAAIQSSIWCTCETSGQQSRSMNFLRCKVCSVACCRDCVHAKQGYQLHSHATQEVVHSKEERDMGEFEMKLRSLLPSNLIFGKEGLDEIAAIENDKYRVTSLYRYVFGLHRIKRDRLKWIAVYYAREDGIEAVAELKIIVGELESRTESADKVSGVQGELTSFFPARTDPLVLGALSPCAMFRQCQGESNLTWTVKGVDSEAALSLVGDSSGPSFRVELGLTDAAANSLKAHATTVRKKEYTAAKECGDERRWIYPKHWRDWPNDITIKDCGRNNKSSGLLDGTYVRVACKQTLNQNACWIRQKSGGAPELYLLIKPDVSRVGPDIGIISRSTDHNNVPAIIAMLPPHWQPCDALDIELHDVEVNLANWIPLQAMSCLALKMDFTVESPPKLDDSHLLIKMNGLPDNDMADLCCRDDASGLEQKIILNVHRGAKAQQTVRQYNLLCTAPFLKHAAEHGLKYEIMNAPWMAIEPKNGIAFGCCVKTLPPRPTESWEFNKERGEWERLSTPGASRQYFLALQTAPQCFDIVADREERSIAVMCHPEVVAHRAAFGLIEGRGDGIEKEVSVTFRLLSVQEDPVLERFRLHNCHNLPESQVPLKKPFELYERQKKAVTKMLRIEKGKVEYNEIEMSEQSMPGSSGWSLIAKASRTTNLRGGVIADAIGAGKTVISIAIILKGIEAARANRSFPRKSSATLVVVPPGLIDQWKSEIKKFTTEMSRVICIYDNSTIDRYSLREVIEADVVICPVDILEAKNYMGRLAKAATGANGDLEVPTLPTQTGQLEKNGAKGVWIPASSADPYGGANHPKSQQRRDESAYFTYVYQKYIREIREKEFKPDKKGIPLEYFEWERVFVDEIHECLCTSRDELKDAKERSKDGNNAGFFQEKNRRAGREYLGITTKDIKKRPLVFRTAIFGLTATPLLDSTNRVIELANLMGNAYVIGLSNHWRNLEKESGRDIFLTNFLEPKQSREMRKSMYAKCQDYLDVAACKNKNEEDMEGIELVEHKANIRMTLEEGKLYKKSQNGIKEQNFAIKPEDFDVSAGHDISVFLRQNSKLSCRGQKLVDLCKHILTEDGNTKIIVFTDGRIGAGDVARECLVKEAELGCTWLDEEDTVEEKNKKLAWYQYADVTEEDKKRPRVLVLHFEHAAGLNLQTECNNIILFAPLYVGDGGTSGDRVADASTELQAIGRVFRPGQTKPHVNVYRIEVQGPAGEECLDTYLIRRNTDEETIQMAINADD